MSNDLTKIDVKVSTPLVHSTRVRQVSGMFDVPLADEISHEWHGEIDLNWDWNIGLIVGPSGSGKSTLARELFGEERTLDWGDSPLVDHFEGVPIREVCDAFGSVGLNTIPSWLKPHKVLSTGERFRADIARLLLESDDDSIILVDEFTSVVDRQVAKIGSHAVQKFVRGANKQFVAVSCHDDIIDWLQPDWVLRPADMTFARRSLQRVNGRIKRPAIEVEIGRVVSDAWRIFAPYHYLTAKLSSAAKCFALFVDDIPVCFAGVLWQPLSRRIRDIVRISRIVTLPDWQGVGLAFVMLEQLARAYAAIDIELRNYPAHPSFIMSHDRSPLWRLERKPKRVSISRTKRVGGQGGRPSACFSWAGDAMPESEAREFLHGATFNR